MSFRLADIRPRWLMRAAIIVAVPIVTVILCLVEAVFAFGTFFNSAAETCSELLSKAGELWRHKQ